MDRVRGGRQKYKRRVEPGPSVYPKSSKLHPVSNREFPGLSLIRTSCLLLHLMVSCILGNKLISHLLMTEPAPLAANQDDSTNDSSLRTLLTLCDLLNRELLVLIGWAKQIPGRNLLPNNTYLMSTRPSLSDTCSAPPPQGSPVSHWSTRCHYCRVAGWRLCW